MSDVRAYVRQLEDDLDQVQALAGVLFHNLQRTRQKLDELQQRMLAAEAGEQELPGLLPALEQPDQDQPLRGVDYRAIGSRLQILRRLGGYRKACELAEAIGLSVSYLSKLECGHYEPTTDGIYRRLCAHLNGNYTWLMTGQGDATTHETTGGTER